MVAFVEDSLFLCVCISYVYWLLVLMIALLTVRIPALQRLSDYGKLNGENQFQLQPHLNRQHFQHYQTRFSLYLHSSFCFKVYYSLASFLNLLVVGFSTLFSFSPHFLILHLLYQCHVTRRLWECYCVHRFSANSKQHLLISIAGISFYISAILTSTLEESVVVEEIRETQISFIRLLISAVLFFLSNIWQYRCHRTLATLRSSSSSSSSLYSIPVSTSFSIVCCPHYSAEIFIYLSMLICYFSIGQLLITLWVCTNLCITAERTHQWYHQLQKRLQQQTKETVPVIPKYRLFPLIY